MIKYKISSFITISDIKDSYDSIPQAYKDGYFIIHNEIEESDYLINSTIKYYIDKFFVGKTELEVLKEIPADVESTGDLLKEACARFFNFLCKTKILVPYNKAENIINTSTAFKEGDRFDSFSILKVLSSRSYTDVYQVADERTGREYVIKLLNKEKTAGITRFQKELKGMKQEYKMLQKVQHVSSINRAYDFKIVSDDQPYILLEYIDGRSLSGCMKEESAALTFNACLEIIEEIITAFSCLHENNILHGDIHSANIMVTAEKRWLSLTWGCRKIQLSKITS